MAWYKPWYPTQVQRSWHLLPLKGCWVTNMELADDLHSFIHLDFSPPWLCQTTPKAKRQRSEREEKGMPYPGNTLRNWCSCISVWRTSVSGPYSVFCPKPFLETGNQNKRGAWSLSWETLDKCLVKTRGKVRRKHLAEHSAVSVFHS